MSKGKYNRQVQFRPETFERLKALENRWGMSQRELIARLFDWLVQLDEPSQQIILGTIPAEYVEDAAQRLAQKTAELATGRKAHPPPAREGRLAS